MKNDEIRARGYMGSYLNGFINLFSFLNLHQGKSSLGDKIIDFTNNSRVENNSIAFAMGYFSELASEIAVPIYITSSSDSIRWYHVLLVDLAIKTIPRISEILLRKSVRKLEDKFEDI